MASAAPSLTTSLCCVLFYQPWILKDKFRTLKTFLSTTLPSGRLHIRNGNELPNHKHTWATASVGARRKTILKIIYDDAFKGRKIHFIARGTVVIRERHTEKNRKPVKVYQKIWLRKAFSYNNFPFTRIIAEGDALIAVNGVTTRSN